MTKLLDKRYAKTVAATWPHPLLPALTPAEAISAAKRLYRFALGKKFSGKVIATSGNRRTWVRSGVLYVNPDQGWRNIVHDLSHYAHRRLHPSEDPHGWHHARLEAAMAAKVVGSGWLDGKLKAKAKAKADLKSTRYQRTLDALTRWETKAKRAASAIKKLKARKRYYEKHVSVENPS